MTPRDTKDDNLDEMLDETFPASDAPGNTVETGIHLDGLPTPASVTDNRELRRFELMVEGDASAVRVSWKLVDLVVREELLAWSRETPLRFPEHLPAKTSA